MVSDPLAAYVCPKCRESVSANAALCDACGAILNDPTGWKPVSLAAAEEADRREAETTTGRIVLNGAILLFPIWGTYTILRLFHSSKNGDGGLGEICVALAVFSAAPIWQAKSIGIAGKILGTLAYYAVTAMVMLFVVLAAVGTA